MKSILVFSMFMVECLCHKDNADGSSMREEHLESLEIDFFEFDTAREAYIYFYPIIYVMTAMFFNSAWPHSNMNFGINKFLHSPRFDWTYPAPSDVDMDLLMSRAWLDLEQPIVFHITDIPRERYYEYVIADFYTINIRVISPRTRNGSWAADQYVIVGPDFRGPLPDSFDDDHVIECQTRFASVAARIKHFGPNDVENVMELKEQLIFTTLYGNEPNVPVFPFIDFDNVNFLYPNIPLAIPEAQVFFSNVNFIIKYLKIPEYETDLYKRFAKIGVGNSKEFIGQKMSQQMYKNIQEGLADGVKKLEDGVAPKVVVNGWADKYKGRFDDEGHLDYFGRAVFVRRAFYYNEPTEGSYRYGIWDGDGDFLDSKYDYTLTFSPDQFPPVTHEYGGFWSVTVYLGTGIYLGALVHNPIDRYSINPKSTLGLVYETSGALTMYFQKKRPDTDAKAANWLPIPDPEFGGYASGEFHVMMRYYTPQDMDYFPPPFVKQAGSFFKSS